MTAKEALEELKAKIESANIELSGVIKYTVFVKENYELAGKFMTKKEAREDIIYWINDMLEKIEQIKEM